MMMNREEALFIFDHAEDIQDKYEDLLFEQKQQLISRPPFSKIYTARTASIERLNDAFIALDHPLSEPPKAKELTSFSDNVFEAFSSFFNQRNSIFREISATNNGKELIRLMQSYLKLYQAYARLWKLESVYEGVLASKEPDPMELISGIKSSQKGIQLLFSDVRLGNAESVVINEAKRLTLWLKLENEHGELR